MLVRSLILPYSPNDNGEPIVKYNDDGQYVVEPDSNGHYFVLDFYTGDVLKRERWSTDVDWDHLSGGTINQPFAYFPFEPTTEPYKGCPTGGDVVMQRLMKHIANRN